MTNKNIVLLVGGVGGAKLAYGLSKIVSPENLTIIVNTGDDFWHYGLRICPDLDTIMYTLSGLVDKTNGWGIADDSTVTLDALAQYGETPWFKLGDKDLATHLLRSHLLREGQTLTQVVQRMAQSIGIASTILPMTDQPVATLIDTLEHGTMAFQRYFVEHRWQPTVKAIHFDEIESAKISLPVKQSLENADIIIVGPSNPWLSINPILSVPGMREAITSRVDIPRVAVTPLIQGQAVKGPTAKIMRELAYTNSIESVIAFYDDAINSFIYDERDAAPGVSHLKLASFDTLMSTDAKRIELAHHLLHWLNDWEV